jgi:hypothetical protein
MINIGSFLDRILGKTPKISKKEQEGDVPITLKDNEIISLTFSITQDGKLFIDGRWLNNTPEMAIILAEFVYMIFSGKIYNNFYSYLQAISNINEEYAGFAQNVFGIIQEKIETEKEVSEEPIIRPSQAFNFANGQQNKQNNNSQIIREEDDIVDGEYDDDVDD